MRAMSRVAQMSFSCTFVYEACLVCGDIQKCVEDNIHETGECVSVVCACCADELMRAEGS